MRMVIPAEARGKLALQLYHLGIRMSMIFPDLDHLAKEVAAVRTGIEARKGAPQRAARLPDDLATEAPPLEAPEIDMPLPTGSPLAE